MECLTHQGRRMSGRSAMMSSPGLMSRTATTPHPFPGRLSSRYILRSSDPHSDHVMLAGGGYLVKIVWERSMYTHFTLLWLSTLCNASVLCSKWPWCKHEWWRKLLSFPYPLGFYSFFTCFLYICLVLRWWWLYEWMNIPENSEKAKYKLCTSSEYLVKVFFIYTLFSDKFWI